MAMRDWSNGVSWTVGICTFVLVNAIRALLRSLLLPDHVRLTGILGLILWFGWLAFVIWMVQAPVSSTPKRPSANV